MTDLRGADAIHLTSAADAITKFQEVKRHAILVQERVARELGSLQEALQNAVDVTMAYQEGLGEVQEAEEASEETPPGVYDSLYAAADELIHKLDANLKALDPQKVITAA